MKRILICLSLGLFVSFISGAQKPFTFVFMTDIHVQSEEHAAEGLLKAIGCINKERPDFVITGGDLIMDALRVHYSRADSLYTLYTTTMKNMKAPVYNTMGNHENFAVYREAGDDTLSPLAGPVMFEKRIGPEYQTFMHKGWKFFLLNSVRIYGRIYAGGIDSVQMEWIRKELAKTDTATPIIVVTHIPLRTVYMQVTEGATTANSYVDVVVNANQVLDLFSHHNLKLVLQGHQHYYEEIYVGKTWFVTGGSIAGSWWDGPYMGVPEGYLVVKTGKKEVTWEYRPYGWEAVK
jgi:3',5'-cyclic-AMP phosphodiesterase